MLDEQGTVYDLDVTITYNIDEETELKELENKLKELIEDYGFEYKLTY